MRRFAALAAFIAISPVLAGCIGNDEAVLDPAEAMVTTFGSDGPQWTTSYELPETVTDLAPAARVEHEGGTGLFVRDGIAYVSAGGAGFYTADVRDPQAPVELSSVGEISARDVDLIDHPDGRVTAVLAGGDPSMHFVDVTNPAAAEFITTLDVGSSVHNLAVVPGTTLVYNSRSLGSATEPGIDIIDATDPADPQIANVWLFPRAASTVGPAPGPVVTTGCHDITVFPDEGRAYCAGVTQTYILDISDPLEPVVVSAISNPLINIHHWALPTKDHSLLLIGDEYGGAAAPACFAHAAAGPASASTPTGALWFYDISDPTVPLLLGWFSPPTHLDPPIACTAHFGELIEDRPLVAVGWYNAGVLLVDFTDPTLPRLVSQWDDGHSVWEARYGNGHLFTGNSDGGMDVLQLV